MSFIMGRGEEAKKAIENSGGNLDKDKGFIRLKAGQSVKVRILSKFDYVAYMAHNHFNNGIYTQPCIEPTGERCLLCEAAKYDGDLVGSLIDTVETQKGDVVSEWASMYAKKRVIFAFADLEEGIIRVFDATKKQADGLISTIEEYGDDLEDLAFTFKRTGEKSETTYTLNPIMPKKMAEVQEAFDSFDDATVPDELFEEALFARSTEEQAKELQKSGFPVKDVFGIDVKAEDKEAEDEGEPITEEDDPTDDF